MRVPNRRTRIEAYGWLLAIAALIWLAVIVTHWPARQ